MIEPIPGKKMLRMNISRPHDLVSILGTFCCLIAPNALQYTRATAHSSSRRQIAAELNKTHIAKQMLHSAHSRPRAAPPRGRPTHPASGLTHVVSDQTSSHGFDMLAI